MAFRAIARQPGQATTARWLRLGGLRTDGRGNRGGVHGGPVGAGVDAGLQLGGEHGLPAAWEKTYLATNGQELLCFLTWA